MTIQLAIDLTVHSEARDVGILRSVERANREEAEWSGQALGMLTAYAAQATAPFLIEDVRAWAEAHGLPSPTNPKAWGAVTLRAKNKKNPIIADSGLVGVGKVNKSKKTLWMAARLSTLSA